MQTETYTHTRKSSKTNDYIYYKQSVGKALLHISVDLLTAGL